MKKKGKKLDNESMANVMFNLSSCHINHAPTIEHTHKNIIIRVDLEFFSDKSAIIFVNNNAKINHTGPLIEIPNKQCIKGVITESI